MPPEEVIPPVAPDAGLEQSVKALTAQLSKVSDPDLKDVLKSFAETGQKTLTELAALRDRAEKADAAAVAVREAEAKASKDAKDATARTKITAAAKAAGFVDAADAVRYISLEDLKANEAGETNEAVLVEALKTAKPHLATKPSTSQAADPPKPGEHGAKDARTLNDAEYAASLKALGVDLSKVRRR